MQDEREKAVELLKSGKYYDEALKWYASRYIMPKTQLATMVVFAAIALYFLFISIVSTIYILPLSRTETFMLNRQLKNSEAIVIRQIGNKQEDASVSYLKYMLAEYVKSREEYNPNRTDRNFNFVVEVSSDDIFMDYLNLSDKNKNPNHPERLYANQAIKEIFVTATSVPGIHPKLKNFVADQEYIANISFMSSLLFVDNTQEKQGEFEATIKFRFEPVDVDQESDEIKELPKLVITDYKTKKL